MLAYQNYIICTLLELHHMYPEDNISMEKPGMKTKKEKKSKS